MRMLRSYIGRRVLVLISGGAFDGTLTDSRDGDCVLEHVTFLDDDGREPQEIEGTVLVPAAQVRWVQVV